MMKVSVTVNTCDLPDKDLKQMSQLGVDCLDIGNGSSFPGIKEQGYPDLDQLLQLRRKIRSWGMDINRVTLPNLTAEFVYDRDGAERELDNSCRALQVFAEAGIPMARQRISGDTFPELAMKYTAEHRGGARVRGEALHRKPPQEPPSPEDLESWWQRFRLAYRRFVPLAEDGGIRLAMHPSDTPHPNTPFGGLGFHRVIDDFPSRQVGLLYCVGTRGQAGGTPLVLDEIYQYGRKGRIFLVHFRNVRGSLATAGGFEEALLDEGDMNMARILWALRKVGYDGCINPDHIPQLEEADGAAAGGTHWSKHAMGWAYSIGYVKALFAAMDEVSG